MSETDTPRRTPDPGGAEKYRRLPARVSLDQVVTTQAATPAGLLWLATLGDTGGCDGGDGDGD
ncbi:hypothetical protein ACGF5C_11570 [Micromonospora sp. NPDC047620]|uniref:hypothetical protein n=1 Tax=Micromonospora sp. NPDC047620 TaxID=3364251 RepID=UPI003712FEFF